MTQTKDRPTMDTASFKKWVESCRKAESPEIIENTSEEHAAILLQNLIIYATEKKKEIKLITGELLPKVYSDLSADVEAALKAGCHIQIAVLCDEAKMAGNRFYQTVVAHENAEVKCLGQNKDLGHFMLVGGSAYRVEVDDAEKKAFASFNDKDGLITPMLAKKFKEIWPAGDQGRRDAGTRLGGGHQ